MKFVYDFKFLACEDKVSKKGNPYLNVTLLDTKSADVISVMSTSSFDNKKFGDVVSCVCELDTKYKNLKVVEVK